MQSLLEIIQARKDGREVVGFFAAYVLKAELIRLTDRFYINITKRSPK